MYYFKLTIILILSVLCCISKMVIAGTEEDMIKNSFKIYKKSLKIKNSFQAASLVSTETTEYY